MEFNKYLILDLESTGLDPLKDRIIKLTTISFSDESVSDTETKSKYFNPKIQISEDSQKIHGISNKEVEDLNEFKHYAKSLASYFENSCVIGYGIHNFHLPILLSEFLRAGVTFDISKIKIIDLKSIYEKLRPRTLYNALKDFCSIEIESFERKSDEKSEAILELFLSQQNELSEKNMSIKSIIDAQNKTLDKEGFLIISENEEILFAKGKYQNQNIKDVKKLYPDYVSWIMDNENISPMVKMILSYEN